MDSLTQIVLGAAVGEVVAGQRLGNRALAWGAIGGTLPDLDVLPSQLLAPMQAMAFHRGFSHSLLFALLAAPLLGYAAWRFHKRKWGTWQLWTWLFWGALVTHPLLDSFTTWGTSLFWPLDLRLAWKSIFVVDPAYTLPFLGLTVAALFFRRQNPLRRKLVGLGLGLSTGYLAWTVTAKYWAQEIFEEALQAKGYQVQRLETKPTFANSLLWYCTADAGDHVLTGYYSFFDEEKPSHFYRTPKNHRLLRPWQGQEELAIFQRMTHGYYSVERLPGQKGFRLLDHRFGQPEGYLKGPQAPFAFSYKVLPHQGQLQFRKEAFPAPEAGLAPFFRRVFGKEAPRP